MTEPLQEKMLEAIKAMAKTLGHLRLYSMSHPTVAPAIEGCHKALKNTFAVQGADSLTISIDQDQLLVNGKAIGKSGQVSPAFGRLFIRLELTSITFQSGLSIADLTSFFALATLKPDSLKGTSPQSLLKEKGVENVKLNEAIYARVDQIPEKPAEVSGPPAAAPAETSSLSARLRERTFEDSVQTLIQETVKDLAEQKAVFQIVMNLLQEELAAKVKTATARIQSEKDQVQIEQTRTESVINTAAAGMVVVDNKGKILMMNPAAEQISGKKLSDVAGKDLTAITAGDQQLLALSRAIGPGQDASASKETEIRGSDDVKQALKASTAVVQNEDGRVVGTWAELPDVTRFKQAQMVQQEFISHVTHELKAPLAAIRSALEILDIKLSGKVGAENARVFSLAIRNTDRLSSLISDILDFSSIQSGKMTVHTEEFGPGIIVQEAVEGLKPWAQHKGIGLETVLEPSLPNVEADPRRTVQIITNLLSNAVKFTEAGDRVRVRASQGTGKHAGNVVVEVEDTGPGIPKDKQKLVFEKFAQIASGEINPEGTGLGLSITKALVTLQKGRIWFKSEPEEGTTFSFTLPVCVYARREAGAPPEKPARKSFWRRLLGW